MVALQEIRRGVELTHMLFVLSLEYTGYSYVYHLLEDGDFYSILSHWNAHAILIRSRATFTYFEYAIVSGHKGQYV